MMKTMKYLCLLLGAMFACPFLLKASERKISDEDQVYVNAAKSFMQAFNEEDLEKSLYYSQAPYFMGKQSQKQFKKAPEKADKKMKYFMDRDEQRSTFKKIFWYKSKNKDKPNRQLSMAEKYVLPDKTKIKIPFQVVRIRITSGKQAGESVDIYVSEGKRPRVIGMIKRE